MAFVVLMGIMVALGFIVMAWMEIDDKRSQHPV